MQTLHTFKKVCAIKRRKGIPGESRMWSYFKAQNGKPPVGCYQVGAVSVWHAVLTKSYPDPSTPVFPLTGWKNISLPSSWASQLNILKTWKFIQYSQKHKALTSVRGGESPPGSTLTAKWDSIPPAQHCHTSLHCWEATLDGLWKKEKKKKSSWYTKHYVLVWCRMCWLSMLCHCLGWQQAREEWPDTAQPRGRLLPALSTAIPARHPQHTCSLPGALGSKGSPTPCPAEQPPALPQRGAVLQLHHLLQASKSQLPLR